MTKEEELRDRIQMLFASKKRAAPAQKEQIRRDIVSCRKKLFALEKKTDALAQSKSVRTHSKKGTVDCTIYSRRFSSSNNIAGIHTKWGSPR